MCDGVGGCRCWLHLDVGFCLKIRVLAGISASVLEVFQIKSSAITRRGAFVGCVKCRILVN